MSKPIDQEREAFEAACQREGFPRPGNFRVESRTYVDERIQGRFEWFQINRAAVQPAGVAVPEGWKLVPIEPTEEMLREASNLQSHLAVEKRFREPSPISHWKAMISFSPNPVTGDKQFQTKTEWLLAIADVMDASAEAINDHIDSGRGKCDGVLVKQISEGFRYRAHSIREALQLRQFDRMPPAAPFEATDRMLARIFDLEKRIAAAPHPVSGEQKADMADAYVGAMEDRNIWKRRALEAEAKIRTYDQRIVDLGVLSMRTAVEKPAAQDVDGLVDIVDDVCEWFELRGLHELNIYKAMKKHCTALAAHRAQQGEQP